MVSKIIFIVGKNQESVPVTLSNYRVMHISGLIKTMLVENMDLEQSEEVPIPNCEPEVFRLVITFCELYYELYTSRSRMPNISTNIFSTNLSDFIDEDIATFINNEVYAQGYLPQFLNTANYLEILPLLEISCIKVKV